MKTSLETFLTAFVFADNHTGLLEEIQEELNISEEQLDKFDESFTKTVDNVCGETIEKERAFAKAYVANVFKEVLGIE